MCSRHSLRALRRSQLQREVQRLEAGVLSRLRQPGLTDGERQRLWDRLHALMDQLRELRADEERRQARQQRHAPFQAAEAAQRRRQQHCWQLLASLGPAHVHERSGTRD